MTTSKSQPRIYVATASGAPFMAIANTAPGPNGTPSRNQLCIGSSSRNGTFYTVYYRELFSSPHGTFSGTIMHPTLNVPRCKIAFDGGVLTCSEIIYHLDPDASIREILNVPAMHTTLLIQTANDGYFVVGEDLLNSQLYMFVDGKPAQELEGRQQRETDDDMISYTKLGQMNPYREHTCVVRGKTLRRNTWTATFNGEPAIIIDPKDYDNYDVDFADLTRVTVTLKKK